ncbi:hypothetical protein ACWF50_19610 [Brucella pseudogrignonensis]
MKFPGKRLIIEYKNRRARKEVKSLWGDINIKEIARAVEDDTTMPAAKNSEVPAAKAPENVPATDKTVNRPTNQAVEQVTGDKPATARTGGRILSTLQEPDIAAARQEQNPTKSKQAPVLQRAKAAQESSRSERHNNSTPPTPSAQPLKPSAPEPSEPAVVAPRAASVAVPQEDRAALLPLEPAIEQDRAAVAQTQAPANDVRIAQPAQTPLLQRKKSARTGKVPFQPHRHGTTTQPAPLSNASHAQRATQGQTKNPTQNQTQNQTLFYHRPTLVADDLAALERENTHLKLALAKKLRAENMRLEKMIVRAISPIDKA